MLKLKVIAASFLLIGLFSFNSAEACFEELAGPCSFTYQQGIDVGSSLGSTETYYHENYQTYLNTLEDFGYCSDYVAGVADGYTSTMYIGEPIIGGGTTNTCEIDPEWCERQRNRDIPQNQ